MRELGREGCVRHRRVEHRREMAESDRVKNARPAPLFCAIYVATRVGLRRSVLYSVATRCACSCAGLWEGSTSCVRATHNRGCGHECSRTGCILHVSCCMHRMLHVLHVACRARCMPCTLHVLPVARLACRMLHVACHADCTLHAVLHDLHVACLACCKICMLHDLHAVRMLHGCVRVPAHFEPPKKRSFPKRIESASRHSCAIALACTTQAALPSLEYPSKVFLPNDTGRAARSEACTCLALVCQTTATHSVTLPLRERVRQHDGELHAPRRMLSCAIACRHAPRRTL